MKALVIGVKRVAGIAKATGNPFDMTRVVIGSPVAPVNNDRMTVEGFGYEVNEIPMDVTAMGAFRSLRFPCVVDLETDSRPYRGKLELIVTGVKAEKAAA